MTTITYGRPTWVFSYSDKEMREALYSGWSRWDLVWERLQENANRAVSNGRRLSPSFRFAAARALAAIAFSSGDPRIATSVANVAFAARLFGASLVADRMYASARSLWARAPEALDDMKILPRARSSVFHMRMEIRHRDAYRSNATVRLGRFIAETGDCLDCLSAGSSAPHRLFSRWRGEKPPLFDDTRKILGACLLVASLDE
ncbi:MAG: tetratricopeptide repeat-containing protein [Albidovulum sp.]|nr:tetratricopeptide repeat-containing protein [Albidovulum sp.]